MQSVGSCYPEGSAGGTVTTISSGIQGPVGSVTREAVLLCFFYFKE